MKFSARGNSVKIFINNYNFKECSTTNSNLSSKLNRRPFSGFLIGQIHENRKVTIQDYKVNVKLSSSHDQEDLEPSWLRGDELYYPKELHHL